MYLSFLHNNHVSSFYLRLSSCWCGVVSSSSSSSSSSSWSRGTNERKRERIKGKTLNLKIQPKIYEKAFHFFFHKHSHKHIKHEWRKTELKNIFVRKKWGNLDPFEYTYFSFILPALMKFFFLLNISYMCVEMFKVHSIFLKREEKAKNLRMMKFTVKKKRRSKAKVETSFPFSLI
jgi:hypothetical protein